MLGPKKYAGKNLNSHRHVHTNRKVKYSDFDTFSMLQQSSQRTTAASAAKSSGGIKSSYHRHSKAAVNGAQNNNNNNNNSGGGSEQMLIGSKASNKNGGHMLSDQMDTNSFNSAGFVSSGQLNAIPLPSETTTSHKTFWRGHRVNHPAVGGGNNSAKKQY